MRIYNLRAHGWGPTSPLHAHKDLYNNYKTTDWLGVLLCTQCTKCSCRSMKGTKVSFLREILALNVLEERKYHPLEIWSCSPSWRTESLEDAALTKDLLAKDQISDNLLQCEHIFKLPWTLLKGILSRKSSKSPLLYDYGEWWVPF